MPRSQFLQNSLVAGELSPRLFGRTDISEYSNGLSKARNVYLTSQGGAFRREGSVYIEDAQGVTVLKEFFFSAAVKYGFAISDQRIDIYKDRANVHNLTGSIINDLTEVRLSELNFVQSQDFLFIFHPDIEPIQISNTGGDTSWSVARVSFENVPVIAYGAVSESNQTGTLTFTEEPQVRTYKITRTSGSFSFTGKENQRILFRNGVLEIKSVTSATVAIAVELVEPTDYTDATAWVYQSGFEPAWSASRGWPTSAAFFQQRLWILGSKGLPNGVWASATSDFFNFKLGFQRDDDAIFVTADTSDVPAIYFGLPGRALQVFSSTAEFAITGSTGPQSPITPSNISIRTNTTHGSERVMPVSVDGTPIFIERGGQNIRNFVYNELEQSFSSPNVSILAEHLIQSPVDMAVRRSSINLNDTYTYIVNGDGTMAVMNILRSEGVLQFSLFETDGLYEAVETVGDDVYLIVSRDGTRFVEVLDDDVFFDAAVQQSSDPDTDTITGLSHLEGEDVEIRVDGFPAGTKVVSSGEVVADTEGGELQAGLPFFATISTMPVVTADRFSSNKGEYKRLVSANVLYKDTISAIIKRTDNNDREVISRPTFRKFGSNLLDQVAQPFSGWKQTYIAGVNRESIVTITQDVSGELNVLAINVEVSR